MNLLLLEWLNFFTFNVKKTEKHVADMDEQEDEWNSCSAFIF